MIVWGTRRYGWVDEVEGLGTVATTFFHLMFVPLIPISTWLVLDGDRGIPLPMSLKSVLVAWVRAALFWGAVASWVAIPATFGLTCVLGAPLTAGWVALPWFVRRASPRRAEELRALLARS